MPSHAIPPAFARRVSLSRREVAETLGCSVGSVDNFIASGKLRTSHVGRTVFVVAADVWALAGVGGEPELSPRAAAILREVS